MNKILNNNITENNDWTDFVQYLEKDHECSICLEYFNLKSNKLTKSYCNHYYCKPCYNKISICSTCKSDIRKNNIKLKTQSNIQININRHDHFLQREESHINNTPYSFDLRPEIHQPAGAFTSRNSSTSWSIYVQKFINHLEHVI